MASFIKASQKRVGDVHAYLRDKANGNSIRYRVESGKTHLIYIPYQETTEMDESGNPVTVRSLKMINGNVHEWTTPDGRYHSTVCAKDTVIRGEDGTVINDGTCPFCERISDAWDIVNMRVAKEEQICTLPAGSDQLKEHMDAAKRTFMNEMKCRKPSSYNYLLVVQFRTDGNKPLIDGTTGLPMYDLKVMKMTDKKLEQILSTVENSGDQLEGCELMFKYPVSDDIRVVGGRPSISVVFPNNRLTAKYPNLKQKIDADFNKFDFEGLDKQGFPEWAGMSTEQAKTVTDSLFSQWDAYQKELKVNPNAQYLEYITAAPDNNPSLSGAPAVPTLAAPTVAAPSVAAPTVAAPEAPTAPAAPAAPTLNASNISDLFGTPDGSIQI